AFVLSWSLPYRAAMTPLFPSRDLIGNRKPSVRNADARPGFCPHQSNDKDAQRPVAADRRESKGRRANLFQRPITPEIPNQFSVFGTTCPPKSDVNRRLKFATAERIVQLNYALDRHCMSANLQGL